MIPPIIGNFISLGLTALCSNPSSRILNATTIQDFLRSETRPAYRFRAESREERQHLFAAPFSPFLAFLRHTTTLAFVEPVSYSVRPVSNRARWRQRSVKRRRRGRRRQNRSSCMPILPARRSYPLCSRLRRLALHFRQSRSCTGCRMMGRWRRRPRPSPPPPSSAPTPMARTPLLCFA